MTIEAIRERIEELCASQGVELICPVEINKRLKTTYARVKYSAYTLEPQIIEFSAHLLETASDYEIDQIVIHETAHYILTMKTGERHGHDHLFKEMVKELGGDEWAGKSAVPVEKATPYKYMVYCPNCGPMKGYDRFSGKIAHLETCSCGKCGSKGLYWRKN